MDWSTFWELRKTDKPFFQYLLPRSAYSLVEEDILQPEHVEEKGLPAIRHRDAYNKLFVFSPFNKHKGEERFSVERCIDPETWELRILVIQAASSVNSDGNVTWHRKKLEKSKGQTSLKLAMWPYQAQGRLETTLKYFASSLGMILFFYSPDFPTTMYNGHYPPFKYHFNGTLKDASNRLELSRECGRHDRVRVSRALLPRHLMFIHKVDNHYETELVNVDEWQLRNPQASAVQYLFISWTGQHFNTSDQRQKYDLLDMAIRATVTAGLTAFWISSECMDREHVEEDVYRMNDVIRAARDVAIMLPERDDDPGAIDRLREFAERVWTFPEILLSPARRDLAIWVGTEPRTPYRTIPKSQFAAIALADAADSRQLIDHFENTLQLSRLQLPSIALKCLFQRSVASGRSKYYFPGDHSYALSGLLLQRPDIDKTDSEFQAFARLSLANDSDMLLERLVSILPLSRNQDWYDTEDQWGVKLWDFYPSIQVSAICDGDSVLLDGAHGVSVVWHELPAVASVHPHSKRDRLGLLVMSLIAPSLASSIVTFALGAYLSAPGARAPLLLLGALAFIGFVLLFFITPALLKHIYTARSVDYQPYLIGFEGYMPVSKIEPLIWPEASGRLTWSRFSSPLSSHRLNKFGECVGADPMDDDMIKQRIEFEQSRGARLFTIIDTVTMTATLILADRPPSAFLVCGSEGGMQRAVGVSYDFTTQTVYKETVMRMETTVMDRMSRVPRCRFGFRRTVQTERIQRTDNENSKIKRRRYGSSLWGEKAVSFLEDVA